MDRRTLLSNAGLFLLLTACAERDGVGGAKDSAKGSEPKATAAAPDRLPGPDTLVTYAYVCADSSTFVAHLRGDSAWVQGPQRQWELQQTAAPTGLKYQGRDSGLDVTYWMKGDSALLIAPERVYGVCASAPGLAVWPHAWQRGADIRAIGQEPGWLLEVHDGERILLLADYATRRIVTPAPPPGRDSAKRELVYDVQTEAHRLRVVVQERTCFDGMSGERHTLTVRVTIDGEELQGCGRARPTNTPSPGGSPSLSRPADTPQQ